MSETPAPYQADTEDDLLGAPERWEKGLAEIADLLAEELRAAGFAATPDLPGRLAFRLCKAFGGQQWYIPKAASLERARRDDALFRAHDGTRHGPNGVVALAQQAGLSEIYLYRLLDRQRELRRKQVQPELGL
jgi:Mor family transcriptional regulator